MHAQEVQVAPPVRDAVGAPPAAERQPPADPLRRRRRGWVIRRALLAADVVGLTAAFLVAEGLIRLHGGRPINLGVEAVFFALSIPCFVLLAKIYGLYDRDDEQTNHSTVDDFVGVFHLCTVSVWLLYAFAWMTNLAHPPIEKLFYFWVCAVFAVPVGRSVARSLVRRRPSYLQNTIVVGTGDVAQLVARKLRQHGEYGIRLLGFVDSDPLERRAGLDDVEVLGSLEELPALVSALDVHRVVIAFMREPHERLVEVTRALAEREVQIDIVPRLYELVGPSVQIRTVEALPLLGLPPHRPSRSSRAVKQLLDVCIAALVLVALSPLLLYIAIRVKLDSPGPVLFRQERVGLNLRRFTVLKFRTMRTDVDQSAHRDYIRKTMSLQAAPQRNGLYKLDRDDAITPFGRRLRRTSLDELPQLLNVLRGEMALVGPRPCIPYELENFSPHHFERFLVRPGMTGLWQVTARAHSTFGEALDIDAGYVRGWSLGLDLWLLCRTPLELLRGRKATR